MWAAFSWPYHADRGIGVSLCEVADLQRNDDISTKEFNPDDEFFVVSDGNRGEEVDAY